MLKGAQKRMIVVKTADSGVFEEAYFVVRANCDCEELDMVAEAEKIIRSTVGDGEKKKKRIFAKKNLLLGMLLCAASAAGGFFVSFIFNMIT